ncbi:MAG: hypothetical protein KJN66_01765 [Bacteroidia bacterium]|nr:hypothetical protein [Bacteroidia bacterium]
MKWINYIFLLSSLSLLSQKSLNPSLIEKSKITSEGLISKDNFNSSYYLTGNTLTKRTTAYNIDYSNIQLGNITSVNIFNPLKINLFYNDFNTVIILDNRLAEIFKIDFNLTKAYKNVSHVSTGYDNTIWIFNQDTQQLELFDYKSNSTKTNTLPIQSEVLDLKSNYNYCWLLTKEYLYKFNYFGINILKLKNNGFISLANISENLILQNDNELFYLKNSSSNPIEIKLPKLLINDFFVNNETLYIYDNEFLYKYQLKIK